MAWDYQYAITLHLVHPDTDPDVLSRRIADIKPQNASRAGEPVELRSGAVRARSRSVWQARLHEKEWLHSQTQEIEKVLSECLDKLVQYRTLFEEIRQDGQAYLQIVYFSDTSHCASVIPADLVQKCGTLGLDLDLEFYAPDENHSA